MNVLEVICIIVRTKEKKIGESFINLKVFIEKETAPTKRLNQFSHKKFSESMEKCYTTDFLKHRMRFLTGNYLTIKKKIMFSTRTPRVSTRSTSEERDEKETHRCSGWTRVCRKNAAFLHAVVAFTGRELGSRNVRWESVYIQ